MDLILKCRWDKLKPQPYLNNVTHAIRQECWKAERKWKKDKLLVSHQVFKDCLNQCTIKAERPNNFSKIIANNSGNPKVLFNTMNSVQHPTTTAISGLPNSRHYRKNWYYQNTYSAPIVRLFWTTNIFIFFHPFQTISLSDPTDIITQTKQGFCCLYVFPTPFLRDGLKTVCPDILAIVNSSIWNGIVAHFLKKNNKKIKCLDPSVHIKFRPVLKLPFLSKALDKVLLHQLFPFLATDSILDQYQSGLRAF